MSFITKLLTVPMTVRRLFAWSKHSHKPAYNRGSAMSSAEMTPYYLSPIFICGGSLPMEVLP